MSLARAILVTARAVSALRLVTAYSPSTPPLSSSKRTISHTCLKCVFDAGKGEKLFHILAGTATTKPKNKTKKTNDADGASDGAADGGAGGAVADGATADGTAAAANDAANDDADAADDDDADARDDRDETPPVVRAPVRPPLHGGLTLLLAQFCPAAAKAPVAHGLAATAVLPKPEQSYGPTGRLKP